MKKRMALILATIIVVVVALLPLKGAVAGFLSQSQVTAPEQVAPIPDLSTLLTYPYPVFVEEVMVEPDRTVIIDKLMAMPETIALVDAMAAKGFLFDPYANAEVMLITIEDATGLPTVVEAMTVSTIANELSGALTAMVGDDGQGFFQAHHTNLDPNLAEVPDPPIIVNGMPYFYITTLRWIGGRIVVWHYWWFDSHHHPNWYYSHYFWYWRFYDWYGWPWPYWHWWVHGWYYWRYWYFWSTWFPWADNPYVVPQAAP